MKKVIKHPKKMKNAMYIVFGAFALALFAITRIHPSYANEGLMIDDALDAIVLYGEVEQLPEDEEVEEVQDEEIQEIEKNQEVEEEDIAEPEETTGEEIDEEETSEDLDETVLERDNKGIDGLEIGGNEENVGDNSEKIEENVGKIQNPENSIGEENLGVSDNTLEDKKEIIEKNEENGEFLDFVDKKNEGMEIMSETSATLLPGQDFNKKIKSLATGAAVTSYYTTDTLITSIQRANEIPSGVTTGLLSTANSNNEIIAWYSDGILYYYSQADTIYLNSDSSYMFSCMKGLTIFDLIGFDTSKVTNMSYMFCFCDNLIKIDLSNFDTSKVTNMYEMFDDCSKLETIYVSSGFIVNANVSVGYMFYNAKKLVGGAGTKWNSSSTDGTYAKIDKQGQAGYFTDPNEIIVNFKVNGNIYETQIKNYGDKLLPIDFPEGDGVGFKKWVMESGEEYDFDNEVITKYTELYAIFDNGNTAILLPGQDFNKIVKSLAAGASVSSYYTADTLITGIQRASTIPSGVTTGLISTPYSDNEVIVWYKNRILYYYSQADTIYLNSDSSYMFSYMKGLTSLEFDNFNTSNVVNMGGMFYYCENLAYLNLSKFNTSNVTDMGYMFHYMKKITSLDISNFDTRNVVNMGYLFGSCDLLETIYAGTGFITDQVTSFSNMYYSDYKLKGGNGTEYSAYTNATDKSMAKVDTKIQSGYFTDLNEITVNFKVFGELYGDQVVAKGGIISRPTNPEIQGYEFEGWYTDENFTTGFDFSQGIEKYTEVYARMDGDEAILLPGKDFNLIIKKLANSYVTSYTAENNTIKAMVRTGNITNEIINSSDTKLISTNYSKYPIYAWYRNEGGTGTIYYYTQAPKIYMNIDSSYMFYYMNELKELDVSNFDTSRVTDMSFMFYGPYNNSGNHGVETLIGLETWDTSKVTTMYEMFAYNTNLTGIDISTFDMSSLENMNFMFYHCDNLRSVNISNIKNIRTMNDAFDYCGNLETVIMDNCDMSNLYYWRTSVFYQNSKLETISMKGWKLPKKIEYLGDFIGYGNKVKTIDATDRDLSNVESMYMMFYGMGRLEKVIGIEDWDTSNVTDMYGAFRGTNLQGYLDLSRWNVSNVENMYEIFRDSTLSGISISGWKLDSIKNMKYMFQSSKLKEVNMNNVEINGTEEDGDGYYNAIMYGMFQSCSNLEKVDMSNSYMGSGTKLNYMFQSLRNLKEVNLENTDFSKVKSMYEMFQSCGLTGINMSGWRLDKVEDMRYMFEASNVKEVNMSNMVINPEGNTNLYGIFNGCHSLENVDMSNTDMRGVTDFAYLFQYLTALKSVNMSNVKVDNLTGMYGMFMSSPNVETVNFSGLDTSKVKDMRYMFQNAYNLKEIIGLEGFDTSSVESMIGMFYGLKAMTGLDLSNFDTRNVKDMRLMFYNAENLETVYVGKSFNTDNVVGTGSENMFSGAISLVGGKGTTFDENHIDKEYAKIDALGDSGYFTQGEFDIKYNLDGGELENKKTSYKIRESFTIQGPVKEEAVFLGWTGSNGNILQKEINIQKGTTGDLEFTANWKANQYKIIFDTDGGNEINSIDVDYNSLLTGINLPIPTKECNDFSRWDVELSETMPAHDITLKAIWEYTCSRSSGGGGGEKKSESTTREIAIDTPTEQEHNSANEEQKSEISSNPENTKKQEIGQEIVIDGGTQKTVAVKNTEIVATVRNTTHSSSSRFTKEQNDAYSFAKSNGITTTSSIEDAKMNTELTRIQMAKMLSNFAINVLGQEPDPEKGIVKFNDVTNKMDKQYDNAVTKAYQLGIMGQNMKNNEFRPSDTVTRAEFASALSRLLYQTEEGEYKGTGKYYIPHVSKLYNEGIINKTDPKIKEKRGYVMTMLMRTVQ